MHWYKFYGFDNQEYELVDLIWMTCQKKVASFIELKDYL